MTFSPQLEARFEKLLRSYPPGRQRAALVPMLLYAQDEVGAVTPEVVEEIGRRLGVSTLEIEEVISYYSMLRRTPAGKHHIQICTNISCMLLGAEELWEHACRRLGIGHREVTPDGQFSLEEVECIGACSWAPALLVNYDYHHHMTPEKLDRLIESLRKPQ
ncbi:MAG: NAD(P)H-dependent oxidoreductase subunit E [Bryobacterales bacterium]|nr:NAD(P)H-dependent oxidoreductase subunit E [Bryobacteraceae bacterium]MDW8355508.1 NAD(P)H-dependent oxidoreductase subunit E [Bryobacterales bacterium]